MNKFDRLGRWMLHAAKASLRSKTMDGAGEESLFIPQHDWALIEWVASGNDGRHHPIEAERTRRC